MATVAYSALYGAFTQGVDIFLKRGVSLFRSCYDTLPFCAVEATDVIRAIGGCHPVPKWALTWKDDLTEMRACSSAKKRAFLKRMLPAITWSGVFYKRGNSGLIKHSGLICLDLDKIGGRDEIDVVLEKLRLSEFLWAAFVSPSQNGLKAIFACDCNENTHGAYFRLFSDHVKSLTGMDPDNTPDVSRLCYVSHDTRVILMDEDYEHYTEKLQSIKVNS